VIKVTASLKKLLKANKIVEKEIRKTIPAKLVSATVGLHKDTGLHYMRNIPYLIPVAQVGAFGHFGREGQPERPWLDKSLISNMDKWKKTIALHARKDKNLNVTMKHTASAATSIMKKYVSLLTQPKNSEATVAIKGFDNPLIHTKQMLHSIDYKIYKKGKYKGDV
jgi:hypothetical protein